MTTLPARIFSTLGAHVPPSVDHAIRAVVQRAPWLFTPTSFRVTTLLCVGWDVWHLRAATDWWTITWRIAWLAGVAFMYLSAAHLRDVVNASNERWIAAQNAHINSLEKHAAGLRSQVASALKTLAQVSRVARLNERAADAAEERARIANRNAMHWRYKAEEWEAIAIQNAEAGVHLAHVMTTQLAQVAGEAEVQRTPQLLADSERKN